MALSGRERLGAGLLGALLWSLLTVGSLVALSYRTPDTTHRPPARLGPQQPLAVPTADNCGGTGRPPAPHRQVSVPITDTEIEVSPPVISESLGIGLSLVCGARITNTGTEPYTFTITENGGGAIPWAESSILDGILPPGAILGFFITLDTSGLAPGFYTGTLLIEGNAPPATITLQMQVVCYDWNQNGVVDISDVQTIAGLFDQVAPPPYDESLGIIDIADITLIANLWGTPCSRVPSIAERTMPPVRFVPGVPAPVNQRLGAHGRPGLR